MAEKRYKIAAEDLEPLAEGRGGCFATDMITVDGLSIAAHRRKTAHGEEGIEAGEKQG